MLLFGRLTDRPTCGHYRRSDRCGVATKMSKSSLLYAKVQLSCRGGF